VRAAPQLTEADVLELEFWLAKGMRLLERLRVVAVPLPDGAEPPKDREGESRARDERPDTVLCATCGRKLAVGRKGPLPKWCRRCLVIRSHPPRKAPHTPIILDIQDEDLIEDGASKERRGVPDAGLGARGLPVAPPFDSAGRRCADPPDVPSSPRPRTLPPAGPLEDPGPEPPREDPRRAAARARIGAMLALTGDSMPRSSLMEHFEDRRKGRRGV
jgi:hypothetical protein